MEPLRSLGGLRPILADEGVSLEMNYLGDTIGVVSGGLKQGAPYAGRFEAVVEADLEKTLALKGMTFHAGAYQIHGNGPSENFIGDVAFESDVEALPTTRLDEVWLEQKLLNDRASLRVGQIAADVEFSTSLVVGIDHWRGFRLAPGFFREPAERRACLPLRNAGRALEI